VAAAGAVARVEGVAQVDAVRLATAGQLRKVTIVDRRSGPGYRIVLNRVTARGTPVAETLHDCFASIESARAFAVNDLGADPISITVAVAR
jgi:hypothetical protein